VSALEQDQLTGHGPLFEAAAGASSDHPRTVASRFTSVKRHGRPMDEYIDVGDPSHETRFPYREHEVGNLVLELPGTCTAKEARTNEGLNELA